MACGLRFSRRCGKSQGLFSATFSTSITAGATMSQLQSTNIYNHVGTFQQLRGRWPSSPVSPLRTSNSSWQQTGHKNTEKLTRWQKSGVIMAAMDDEDEGRTERLLNLAEPLYTIAVLGDLHLEDNQMDVFHAARRQIMHQLTDENGEPVPGARIFQLGDVGGYTSQPGSSACFERAVPFLDAFGVPRTSVTGNHDLEGTEYETDEANLAAWQSYFGQHHYWMLELGQETHDRRIQAAENGNGHARQEAKESNTICIGLSTVQFRNAPGSCHEVFIDEEQIKWFRKTLAANKDKTTFVFTHAPPMGSGLTSLQEVHVRNRCSWLNHSSPSAKQFLQIVSENPQIKLWFSGHFHLSHDYEGSISRRGNCLFVQTGVMGECHRDGKRHSRFVKGDANGYQLYTLDHGSGDMRLDAVHSYSSQLPPQRLWCSSLFYVDSCPGGGAFSPVMPYDSKIDGAQRPLALPSTARWFMSGDSVFAVHANQLVEYDMETRAPMGVVCDAVNGRTVRLVSIPGEPWRVSAVELLPGEESKAYEQRRVNGLELKGGTGLERFERMPNGGFSRVFQFNKWHKRRQVYLDSLALK